MVHVNVSQPEPIKINVAENKVDVSVIGTVIVIHDEQHYDPDDYRGSGLLTDE